tara:strand:+ start:112 stop:417 length:306 start_codon:yes stop_codon:yes gene_type:complete
MNKKIIIILSLLVLTNCAPSGTAFLGPVITGAKTGSVYQASISYSSGKVMNTIRKNTMHNLIEFNKNNSTESTNLKMPIILATNKIYPIYISEVEIIEPLP